MPVKLKFILFFRLDTSNLVLQTHFCFILALNVVWLFFQATLRQEGLFATYQKNRTVAIQSLDTHTEKGQGPTGAPGAIGATGTKGEFSIPSYPIGHMG